MENPIKMDDLGGKPIILGNNHLDPWERRPLGTQAPEFHTSLSASQRFFALWALFRVTDRCFGVFPEGGKWQVMETPWGLLCFLF